MTTPQIPDELLAYFQTRQQQRDDELAVALRNLDKKRNKRLVGEAAVMGFVQGYLHAGGGRSDDDFPKDAEILRSVLEGGKAYPDIYRRIAALFREREVS